MAPLQCYQFLPALLILIFYAVQPTSGFTLSKTVNENGSIPDKRPWNEDTPPQLVEDVGPIAFQRHSRSADSDAIVFPDQVDSYHQQSQQKLDNRMFVIRNTTNPPPCARGSTYCETVEEYPIEHVVRILKRQPILKNFLHDDITHYGTEENVEDRIDGANENPLCIYNTQTVFPKIAMNEEGNWLFVVNHEEYKQGVVVETCVATGECSVPAALPVGYTSSCKQKYIYRKLLALDDSGNGVASDSFAFPSCCMCIIRFDHSRVMNRVGGVAVPLPLSLPKSKKTQ